MRPTLATLAIKVMPKPSKSFNPRLLRVTRDCSLPDITRGDHEAWIDRADIQ